MRKKERESVCESERERERERKRARTIPIGYRQIVSTIDTVDLKED